MRAMFLFLGPRSAVWVIPESGLYEALCTSASVVTTPDSGIKVVVAGVEPARIGSRR
jgi:hypothetical protein